MYSTKIVLTIIMMLQNTITQTHLTKYMLNMGLGPPNNSLSYIIVFFFYSYFIRKKTVFTHHTVFSCDVCTHRCSKQSNLYEALASSKLYLSYHTLHSYVSQWIFCALEQPIRWRCRKSLSKTVYLLVLLKDYSQCLQC